MTTPLSITVRPILDESDYNATLEQVSVLLETDPQEGSTEFIQMDILATLIEKYEADHYAMETPDPLEAIKFRMDQLGYKRKDLEKILGSAPRVTDIMNRKRGLSIEMIRRLHNEWNIPAHILIKETRKTI